jgi:hypothetical protein
MQVMVFVHGNCMPKLAYPSFSVIAGQRGAV